VAVSNLQTATCKSQTLLKSVHIKIHGTVQGVFFRKHAHESAIKLGVNGWVKNVEDGTVEIEAEAPAERLDLFIKWCHHGPGRAVVNKVIVTESSLKNFTSFEIKR
jgi:acylphosphatase